VRAKQKQIAALDIPDSLRAKLALARRGTVRPDEVFAGILTPQEWRELREYPIHAQERCERLIGFVEDKAPLDEDLKGQIRRMYGISN